MLLVTAEYACVLMFPYRILFILQYEFPCSAQLKLRNFARTLNRNEMKTKEYLETETKSQMKRVCEMSSRRMRAARVCILPNTMTLVTFHGKKITEMLKIEMLKTKCNHEIESIRSFRRAFELRGQFDCRT